MAANETAPAPAPDETRAEGDEQGSGGASAGRGNLLSSPIARGGLFVLLLGINALVSFFVVQKVIRPRVATEESQAVEAIRPEVPEPGELFVLDNIIVNPAGTRATRYLRVGAAIEYDAGNAGLGAELDKRKYQFRDLLITELSSRTVDELLDVRVKEEIREELLARLNGSISAGQISNLYFTEYVIQ